MIKNMHLRQCVIRCLEVDGAVWNRGFELYFLYSVNPVLMGINNAFKNLFPLRFSACPLCHLCNLLLCPHEWWWSIYVCLSVHLSVRAHISRATHAIFTKFFVHVVYGCGLVLLWQGDRIPGGRGSFGGFLPHWRCIVTCSLKKG